MSLQVPGLHCDADAHMSDRQRSDSSQEEGAEQESEIALKLEHARSCAAVRFQVHMAKREAAAADAAVAAVTQVSSNLNKQQYINLGDTQVIWTCTAPIAEVVIHQQCCTSLNPDLQCNALYQLLVLVYSDCLSPQHASTSPALSQSMLL